MNFEQALTVAKKQVGYDDYLRSIDLGRKPREDLPLLNRLVNCMADIYSSNATTLFLADGELCTIQAIGLCRKISHENRDQLIQALRNVPITSVQAVLFQIPAHLA